MHTWEAASGVEKVTPTEPVAAWLTVWLQGGAAGVAEGKRNRLHGLAQQERARQQIDISADRCCC